MQVSIIIPIYNVEKYIEECLESVYQQTYPHIEVIIINDCTPDNSMIIVNRIVNKYKDKFPTTIINNEYNKGLSESRNSGINIAKGDYIYFLDSDDCIIHNAIELLIDVAYKYKGIEIVEGDYFISENYNSNIPSYDLSINIYNEFKSKEYFLVREANLFAWNILYKTDFIIKNDIKFYSNLIYEDIIFRMQITQHLSYMAKTSAKTYFYRYNELSLSHKATIKNLQSIKYILVYTNRIISNKLQLAPLYISCFCKNAFLYWNKPCRMLTEHKYYLKSITKIVKYTLLKYFRKFSFINFCMVIPFFIPYKIAPFFVKIIWKLYPKLIRN